MSQQSHRSRRRFSDASSDDTLLDPALLQEYEYASEGAADRIITMARLEQEHRQRMEEETLSFYRFSYRFGQTCGLTIVIGGIAAASYLGIKGNETLASFVTLVVFSTLAFAHVTSFFTIRRFLEPEMSLTGYVPAKPKRHKKKPAQPPKRKPQAKKTPSNKSGDVSKKKRAEHDASAKQEPSSHTQGESNKRRRKRSGNQQKNADASKNAS